MELRIPTVQHWEILLPREAGMEFDEDNQAMIRVCPNGRNPTIRHLGRTHRVCIMWLYERFPASSAADFSTDGFTDAQRWLSCCLLRNLVDLGTLRPLFGQFTKHQAERLKLQVEHKLSSLLKPSGALPVTWRWGIHEMVGSFPR